MDVFNAAIHNINTNKLLVGVAMLVMNMGSRYILADFTKLHEKVFMSTAFKTLVIFAITFVATRDFMSACILTFAFIVIMYGLLNETRKFNLLHSSLSGKTSKGQLYKDII